MSGHGASNPPYRGAGGKVVPAAFPPPVDSKKEFI